MAGVHYNLVPNTTNSPPEGAVQLASQSDGSGLQWTAVAHTEWGDIPGKAKADTCWFSHGGQEHLTKTFSWVCTATAAGMVLILNNKSGPPKNALKVGHQTDGTGDLYAAVANTEHGTIPGKAKDDTCWYPHSGEERLTTDFYWVCHQ